MTSAGIAFDDPEWTNLRGGYGVPYDPREALRALEHGDSERAWAELWNELHHQGDIGDAAFAALPHLVRIHQARGISDFNTYALAAIIEDVRRRSPQDQIPERLRPAYEVAWRRLSEIALFELPAAQDPDLVSAILAVLSMAKGQLALGRFAYLFSENERNEMFAAAGWD